MTASFPSVIGVGARTAIGMSAASSAAAVRADISGFGRHPFMVDRAGKPLVVASAPYLTDQLAGTARLFELAAPALCEAVRPLCWAARPASSIPVFLGVASAHTGHDGSSQLGDRLRAVLQRCGMRAGEVTTIAAGHASGAMALHAAWRATASGDADFALAGGVDSYLEPETLEWLEACDQLHSAGEENNPYGFIPGEAGAFVLLASSAAVVRHELDAKLEIPSAAIATETKLIKTDAVCTGEALTALLLALQRALPPPGRFDQTYVDMNGETYRADEFGFATVRANQCFRDASQFMAPADCWGDVGAASGPLFVVLADAAARKGYAAGPTAVILTGSEKGQRSGLSTVAVREAGGR